VLELAARVLAQEPGLTAVFPAAQKSPVLAVFDGDRCAGFLRYLIQVISAEEGRPTVRSPVTSTENYALKLDTGYVLHPSRENDSYYFLIRL
jgi:hypothetical protein